jgi:hypothetical protein
LEKRRVAHHHHVRREDLGVFLATLVGKLPLDLLELRAGSRLSRAQTLHFVLWPALWNHLFSRGDPGSRVEDVSTSLEEAR